jgi:hypothetical protein
MRCSSIPRRLAVWPGGPDQKEAAIAEKKTDLLTAGDMAKALNSSDATVKKAIWDLAIRPAAKRGVCNLYGPDALKNVKAAIAK